jgi:uncharacterized protein YqgV (UPF0045/DUF77 family)
MTTSAQVSLYPLQQEHLAPAIDALVQACRRHGLAPQVGPMSTLVTGDASRIFAALGEGFARATALGPAVLTVTMSSACPAAGRP